MDKTFIFHSDPGHGWLQVSKSDLEEFGVADKITPFSYVNRNFVFLEEDCDAGVFINAYEKKHGKMKIVDKNYNDSCLIREYARYYHD